MTKDEALKLALEALEQLQGGCTDSDDGTYEAITVWCPEVIDAIRSVLAQPEQEPVGEIGWAANVPNSIREVHWKELCPPVGTKLYTTPPQRTWVGLTDEEMSIVALREKTSDHDVDCLCADCTLLDEMEDAQKCYCGNIYRLGVVHRESSFCDEHPRKPLTNEDIALIDWESLKTKKDCVRAIEAAHGIKE